MSGKGCCPSSPQKHHFAFQGMVVCGYCGCAMVAEIKKGKYIYYHCSQSKGKCPGTYVREEELDRQFLESLQAIKIDDEVLQWVVKTLKYSFADEKRYHDEAISALQKANLKMASRLEAIYIDKLDGKISLEFYETTSAKWRAEQDDIQRKMEQHKTADRSYIDEGVKILELAQKAASLYSKQSMEEKRRLLSFVHSNSSWKNGELTPSYRKPFDLLAVSNKAYVQKKTASPMENGLSEFWLPSADKSG